MDWAEFDRTYLTRLNTQQQEAVHAVDGPVLLLAVPGSGKTTVLVMRLGYMVCCRGIPAERILTMTYTVAATKEMQRRFIRFFGEEAARGLSFRTINGVSAKIIEYYSRTHGRGRVFDLLDDEAELARLVGRIYQDVRREFATPGTIKDVRTAITYVKNMMLTPEEIGETDVGVDGFLEIYERYCAELKRRRSMDYDDQMVYAKTILERYPDVLAHFQAQFAYFCVDEAQDTSKIQHAIIRLLAGESGNLFMVGDEDQSIYGFRAAYPAALMEFEENYPGAKVLLMEENYRSTPEILRAAEAFVQKNRDRHPKALRPNRAPGAQVHIVRALDRETQLFYLLAMAEKPGTPAVLYRNNESALPLIDLLDRKGIPFRCRQMDDSFFTHRIVADVADILRFAHDGRDGDCFMRIYYKLGGGISKKAAEYACGASRASGKPILEELRRFPELSSFAKDSTAALKAQFPLLLTDTGEEALARIEDEMRYGAYIDRQKLDKNKLSILALLAKQETGLDGLMARLNELRALVAAPRPTETPGLLLSTIHSSKGLEYDTVYLLDVLDGVLPAEPAPTDAAERQRYEEERRLFYVAMTRAKNHLYLFHCFSYRSAFVDEVLRTLPRETAAAQDIFASLQKGLCGKRYTHRDHGAGKIIARCGGRCLIAYESGERQCLTIGRMFDERAVILTKAAPEIKKTKPVLGRTKKPDLPPEEEAALVAQAAPGRLVTHVKFGNGTIVSVSAPYAEISFPEMGVKKFVLGDALRRGLLRYAEE